MQLDPKGLEAAKGVMRSGSGILIMGEAFDATMEAAINAYLEVAPSPSPAPGVVTDGDWRQVEINHLLKGRRKTPAYFPATGEVCEVSGPNCDDANGYTWMTMTVLWQNDIFVLYGQSGFWPNLHKHEHVLFRPASLSQPAKGEREVDASIVDENGNTGWVVP